MKTFNSFAFYALVAPVMTIAAGYVVAQQPAGVDINRALQTTQGAQGTQQAPAQSQSPTGSAHSDSRSQAGMQHRGYMPATPANAMHLTDLMGAEVSTASDEAVGAVSDLIIDESGQVVAIVVGVGGFLGMAEKDVAIGWGHVTRSGDADDQELRIDVTGEELRAAPAFERE